MKRYTKAVQAARARAVELHDENFSKIHTALTSSLRFLDLRLVNVPRRDRWHPKGSIPWTSADWSNALCGEAGELANVVKKIRRYETGTVNRGDPCLDELVSMAAAELADVVIYADLLAEHFHVDLGEAVSKKFNQVSEKYGFPERLQVRP